MYDLVFKIVNNTNNVPSEQYLNYVKNVRNTIGGKLYYDQVSRSIQLAKENDKNIIDINIASGIKGLGLIDILFSENILNDKTLLIIDEPEVHLHPQWEIEYARIIVELSQLGIPIIISTHSAYMLQAIPYYVNKFKTNDITKFYFGEKLPNETKTSFIDVTNDLEVIFKAIAKPMQELL